MGKVIPFAPRTTPGIDTIALETWLEGFGLKANEEKPIPALALNAYHMLCRTHATHPLCVLTEAVLDYRWADSPREAFTQVTIVGNLIEGDPRFRLGYIAWLNMVEQGWWEYEQGRLSKPIVPLHTVNTMIGEALDQFPEDRRVIESTLLAAQSANVPYERVLQEEVDRLHPEVLRQMPQRFEGYELLF